MQLGRRFFSLHEAFSISAIGKKGRKLCWAAKRLESDAMVYLRKCKNNAKQKWVVEDGQVWLFMKDQKEATICVPFQGKGTKLETKNCYRQLAEFSNNGRF